MDGGDGKAGTGGTPAGGEAATAPAAGGPAGAAPELPSFQPGRYVVLETLGRGGQAVVLRARDLAIGREVAIKEHLPTGGAEAGGTADGRLHASARFLREARITGQLEHPNIVPVHEIGRRADGSLYSVQKLIRGRTLKDALAACAGLDERLKLLPNMVDACHAIAYAHSRGVVHRDLKPANVMIGEFGETVVLDWGLAKRIGVEEPPALPFPGSPSPPDELLTGAGARLGTPAYMSPEQIRGDAGAIDERTDVWGLGALLYSVLTGRAPWREPGAATGVQPVRALCPEAPAELAAVAERALALEP